MCVLLLFVVVVCCLLMLLHDAVVVVFFNGLRVAVCCALCAVRCPALSAVDCWRTCVVGSRCGVLFVIGIRC